MIRTRNKSRGAWSCHSAIGQRLPSSQKLLWLFLASSTFSFLIEQTFGRSVRDEQWNRLGFSSFQPSGRARSCVLSSQNSCPTGFECTLVGGTTTRYVSIFFKFSLEWLFLLASEKWKRNRRRSSLAIDFGLTYQIFPSNVLSFPSLTSPAVLSRITSVNKNKQKKRVRRNRIKQSNVIGFASTLKGSHLLVIRRYWDKIDLLFYLAFEHHGNLRRTRCDSDPLKCQATIAKLVPWHAALSVALRQNLCCTRAL